MFGTTKRFPAVRWGFIEAGSSWIPFMAYDIMRRLDKMGGDFTAGHTYDDISEVMTALKTVMPRFWKS